MTEINFYHHNNIKKDMTDDEEHIWENFSLIIGFLSLVSIFAFFVVPQGSFQRIDTIASILLTFSLVIFSGMTYHLNQRNLNLFRESVNTQTKPLIHIYLKSDERYPKIIKLCIENIGLGLAKGVKFRIIQDFMTDSGLLSQYPSMNQVKNYLPSKQPFCFVIKDFGDIQNNYSDFENSVIKLKVYYQSQNDDSYEEEFSLFLSELNYLRHVGDNYQNTRLTQSATSDSFK